MERKLINAVKRQLGGGKEALEELREVYRAPSGAAAGWSGFTYYTETSEFYRKNREAIVALVESMADDLGEGPVKLVLSFGCLKDGLWTESEVGRALYGRWNDDYYQIYNALAWFALEEAAREIGDRAYFEDKDED